MSQSRNGTSPVLRLFCLFALGAGVPNVGAQACDSVWYQTTGPITPNALTRHAMVFDAARQETILFGGRDSNSSLRGETWAWSGTSWRLAADAALGPGARRNPVLVFDSLRNRVVMFGGLKEGDSYSAETWEWNGSSWEDVGTAPSGRSWHTMAFDQARGVTVLFGGSIDDSSAPNNTLTWNGVAWTQVNTCGPGGREIAAMAYDEARERVVLFGGINGSGRLNDTWEWNGSTWACIQASDPGREPVERDSHTMVYDRARGHVVMYGGENSAQVLGDMWEWDGAQWTEIPVPTGVRERYYHAAAYDTSRDRLIISGGAWGYVTSTCLDETFEVGCSSAHEDTDADGLLDDDEIDVYGTDPLLFDTDGDGLGDGDEVNRGTDPLDTDSDNDGLTDGAEVAMAAFGDCPSPLATDSDADGYSDSYEVTHGLNPCDHDSDHDGLTDGLESTYGTNPLVADTDHDGLLDGTEVDMSQGGGCPSPTVADSDGDTLFDGAETANGTSPCNPDTDGDGVRDNIDPLPTVPGVTNGFIASACRDLANQILQTSLNSFNGPNANANKGRRGSLADRATAAANAIMAGNEATALSELSSLLDKIDGQSPPPDWMNNGVDKTILATQVQWLMTLIRY